MNLVEFVERTYLSSITILLQVKKSSVSGMQTEQGDKQQKVYT
jgi:hypothetical protein